MKKLLCIILSLVMLLLFVSCAGDKGATNGAFSSFTATTLEGEEVTQEILKDKKLTMINIWATFCTPCIGEMPDLQKLNEEYSDKGFQVVGVVCDIYDVGGQFDEGGINTAKAIVEDTGVKYPTLLPSQSLKEAKINHVSSVPETVFVDENGNQVGESYIGSRSYDQWADIVEGLLATQE